MCCCALANTLSAVASNSTNALFASRLPSRSPRVPKHMMIRKRLSSPVILLAFLLLPLLLCNESASIAIAPSTFGTAIARAGKISNTLKVSAKKILH